MVTSGRMLQRVCLFRLKGPGRARRWPAHTIARKSEQQEQELPGKERATQGSRQIFPAKRQNRHPTPASAARAQRHFALAGCHANEHAQLQRHPRQCLESTAAEARLRVLRSPEARSARKRKPPTPRGVRPVWSIPDGRRISCQQRVAEHGQRQRRRQGDAPAPAFFTEEKQSANRRAEQ